MKLFEFWLAQTFWIQQASTIAQLFLSECSSAYHYLRMHCSMESLEVPLSTESIPAITKNKGVK